MNEEHCKECGSLFTKKKTWQKFCSPVCRAKTFVRIRNADAAIGRMIRKNAAPPSRDLFAA
jgi:hypothetical protein